MFEAAQESGSDIDSATVEDMDGDLVDDIAAKLDEIEAMPGPDSDEASEAESEAVGEENQTSPR